MEYVAVLTWLCHPPRYTGEKNIALDLVWKQRHLIALRGNIGPASQHPDRLLALYVLVMALFVLEVAPVEIAIASVLAATLSRPSVWTARLEGTRIARTSSARANLAHQDFFQNQKDRPAVLRALPDTIVQVLAHRYAGPAGRVIILTQRKVPAHAKSARPVLPAVVPAQLYATNVHLERLPLRPRRPHVRAAPADATLIMRFRRLLARFVPRASTVLFPRHRHANPAPRESM